MEKGAEKTPEQALSDFHNQPSQMYHSDPRHITIHIHNDSLVPLVESLLSIHQKLNKMANELDDLKAAVAKDTEVDQSAITLLNGLKAKLDAAIASGDPAQLTALSAQLGTNTDALAAAIAANTPAA
jgi:uncharacterized alpha-E superfamily protein